ncbi:MAG TPA: hypothetical protein VFW44_05640 [Bryobacteraceae bacterium]|nr:hypothetical protein [Bryobacteraceae bacterium]
MHRLYKALLGALTAVGLMAIPALAAASAVPGTLNYVEGQVAVAGQPVTTHSIGTVQLEPNQVIETQQGKAEVLLTPGVFLRVGDRSSARLVSPGLANTRVEVLHGQAIVEVTELFKDNNLWILMDGSSTRLEKQGLYAFNADAQLVQVFDGKAAVEQNDRVKDLGKGKELALNGDWKPAHFDTKAQAAQNILYAWSNLRSEYEAEASMQSAQNIYMGGSPYWYGPGWYWNPYWDMYGFIPGDGVWYSPFGWPYYSPWVVGFYGGGYGFGHGYGRGFVGRGYVGHGHVGGGAIASRGRFGGGGHFGGARMGGGFAHGGFAGGMHGGFGGGGRR